MGALDTFIRRYRWRQDNIDGWQVVAAEGDCDDFALTAAYLMCGGSWLKFWWKVLTLQMVFWLSLTKDDQRHMVLWLRGYGWIDNIYPNWSGSPRHRRVAPLPFPVVAFKMLSGRLFGGP